MQATMNSPKAKITAQGEREILIERTFDAPRELVWRAFTEPDLIKQWWGRGNKLVIEKHEPQRGGHWRFVEHSDHGEHGFEGRFREITPNERIIQTFEWDGMPAHPCVEHLTMEDLGDGRTRIRIVDLFMLQEERDGMLNSGMEGGLNQGFAVLDTLLAGLQT
jgi:uncharacterized protein YndB with AHSA1/START domain